MRLSSSSTSTIYAVLSLAHLGFAMIVQAPLPVRLMTQNIRYDLADPLDKGEEPWPVRLPKQLQEYKFHTAHQPAPFIFLQEAIRNQLDDIITGLNKGPQPRWKFIGRGRDKDSVADNEYNPILYQPDIWDLKQWWTRWLSNTPTVPYSKYPNASLPRIVTVGRFQHKASGREVLMLCTHLDNVSPEVRLGQAKVVAATAAEFSKQGHGKPDLPVLVAGDFNSEPSEQAYQYMTTTAPFVDAVTNVPPGGYRYGNDITFTGFSPDIEQERIDFVFLRKASSGTASWQIEGSGVPANFFDDGVYLSDHRPVIVDALLK